jgi:hypothetical protein
MKRAVIALALLTVVAPARASAQAAQVTVEPQPVLVERLGATQFLSFDFRVENRGSAPLAMTRIEVSVYDRRGALQQRKFLFGAGLSHGERGLPRLEPGASAFLINPFDTFDAEVELASLRYEFTFEPEGGAPVTVTTSVAPVVYEPKTALRLPLAGRVLVHDGHAGNAHHRRFDLSHPFLREIGVSHNFTRFASDLCIVDERGELRRGKSDGNDDWYGFGATVYAPAAGRVVLARGTVPDNVKGEATFTIDEFRKDPTTPGGNLVVIDHGNGEFSLMAHLKQGSVVVKAGDAVKAGQPVGQMGVSGDAYLPHVHYELRTAAEVNANGLPAYFHDYVRLLGSRRIRVARGTVDSGDIVESVHRR